MTKASPVQSLYELCKKTFTPSSGTVASPQAIRSLCCLLVVSAGGFWGSKEKTILLALKSPEELQFMTRFYTYSHHPLETLIMAPEPKSIESLGVIAEPLSFPPDTIAPEDVGLEEDNPDDDRGYGFFGKNLLENQSLRAARWAQPITYLHIHENEYFTIGIFCLPTSSVIPLHDHPGMMVFSKILYGSIHVKAYDWIEPPCFVKSGASNKGPVRLAKLHMDTVLSAPCPTSILYPKREGNLHCFTAVSPCAVLDVLAPPYSVVAGRDCNYYRDYPYSSFLDQQQAEAHEDKEDYAWLEETGTPDDFYTLPRRYMGPIIQNL